MTTQLYDSDSNGDIQEKYIPDQPLFLEKTNTVFKLSQIYDKWLAPKKSHLLNLQPSYQREITWEYEAFNNFLDSVFRNYIFNPIILCKLNNFSGERFELDRYECVDGQHRLTCIKMYIEGSPCVNEFLYIVKDGYHVFYKETPELNSFIVSTKKKAKYRYMHDYEKEMFDGIEFSFQIIQDNLNKRANLKAEIFNRIQNGARISNFDILKNLPHPLCIFLRDNVFTEKIFKLQLFEKIIFYQKTINSNVVVNITNKSKNECYFYFMLRIFYIYQRKTISFGMFDMNLNLRKKLDDQIKNPAITEATFPNSIDEYTQVWETMKLILRNIHPNTILAEPLYYYLFYSFHYDKPVYNLLKVKINWKDFMKIFNDTTTASVYYVASSKLKSQKISDTYEILKKHLQSNKSL